MPKFSQRLIFGMIFLLTSCGTKNISTPETPPTQETSTPLPSESIAPSPEPAPTMDTPTPSPTTNANADVTHVRALQDADGSWAFHVTVSHPDTGWDDYANGWDIVFPDGSKFKIQEGDEFTRLLAHPHVNEQPFTRSQRGIIIPEGVTQITVRAHDILDGFGGKEIIIDLTKDFGKGFEVER